MRGATVYFTLAGRGLIAFDSPTRHEFDFTPSTSIFVRGGDVKMPVGDYGLSSCFGWATDRYGVSWQIGTGRLRQPPAANAVLGVVLALALIAAVAVWPPWQTIAQGSTAGPPISPSPAAFVVGSPPAVDRFSAFLRPEDATAVRRVDFERNVVVAAFVATPTPCHRVEIVGLQRVRAALTVTVTVHPPAACIFPVASPYHLVAVPRLLIGRPLPRQVQVRVLR